MVKDKYEKLNASIQSVLVAEDFQPLAPPIKDERVIMENSEIIRRGHMPLEVFALYIQGV